MKLNLNISNKAVVFAFFLLLMGATVFYAQARIFTYNRIVSQGEAFGHGADELVVRMNDGTLKTVQELLTNGVGAAPAPAAAGWTLIGGLSDPAGTVNSQSVSFNLASQSDVLLVVYANFIFNSPAPATTSTLSFKMDGSEVDKAIIRDDFSAGSSPVYSTATLSHRVTALAAGAHTLRLDAPSPGSFAFASGGNKPRFYIYQLTGGSGASSANKFADTGWIAVANNQTYTVTHNLDNATIFVEIFASDNSAGTLNVTKIDTISTGGLQYGVGIRVVDANKINVKTLNGYLLHDGTTVPAWTNKYMRVIVGRTSATGIATVVNNTAVPPAAVPGTYNPNDCAYAVGKIQCY